MQPIPSKVVAWSIKFPEFFDVAFMHSRQVIHDKFNELWLSSTIAIDEGTKALGILGPAVASNQYTRLATRARWIGRVNYSSDREVSVGLATSDFTSFKLLPPRFLEANANLAKE